MKFKEITTIEQYSKIMKNPVLVYYHEKFPNTVICVSREDIYPVIADNYTSNITVTDPLDLLVCNTSGPFIMDYGPAVGNRYEFTSELSLYQLGIKELPEDLLYMDWRKDYNYCDEY